MIFEYIRIFWTNIFICKNICWFFHWRIYLDIHLWYFYHAEYIRKFIRPISMVTNIFGYSFVQKFDIRPTLLCLYLCLSPFHVIFFRVNIFRYSFVIFLSCQIYLDIHSSNIYGNKYILIFIRPKNLYLSHTALDVFELLRFGWFFPFFNKIGFLGILGPPRNHASRWIRDLWSKGISLILAFF